MSELSYWDVREKVLTRSWTDFNNGQRSGLVLSASFPSVIPTTYSWMGDPEVIRSVWGNYQGLFTLCELKKIMEPGCFGIVHDAREYRSRGEPTLIITRWIQDNQELTEHEHDIIRMIKDFADSSINTLERMRNRRRDQIRSSVREIMDVVDSNRDKIQEGAYLCICDAVMKAWNTI